MLDYMQHFIMGDLIMISLCALLAFVLIDGSKRACRWLAFSGLWICVFGANQQPAITVLGTMIVLFAATEVIYQVLAKNSELKELMADVRQEMASKKHDDEKEKKD